MKSQPFKVGQIYRDVLQDGETRRVPLMLKDAAAFCRECGGLGRFKDASIRCPFCKGSGLVNSNGEGIDETVANNTEGARGGEFGADRATLSNHDAFMLRDAEIRLAASGNRPGYRFVADSEERRAAQQKIADAHEEYNRYITTAYRDVNQSRNPDVDWSTGAGSPGRNFGKPPQEGDVCTTSAGQRGVIRNGECVASREDSRTVSQVAADHAQNMENVYQEHSNYLQNAWRNLR
jgi:hypothetical protein